MGDTTYSSAYRDIDFSKEPERYIVGRGEQGVLIAQPYKSELLPHWKFKTPKDATESSDKLFSMFKEYRLKKDFVGMDMARKFLQMGFTRSRRYANHPSGKKYEDGAVRPQSVDQATSDKAESAKIFYARYKQVVDDEEYIRMKREHMKHEVDRSAA